MDDIQVLGPEHEQCVIGYHLLRGELAKRTSELDEARQHLANWKARDAEVREELGKAFGVEVDRAAYLPALILELAERWGSAEAEAERVRDAMVVSGPLESAAPGPLHPEGSTEGHFEPDRSRARCQPESTPSPGPRVWKKGDPEPDEGVSCVRHSNSQHFIRETGPSLWRSGKGSAALTWRELTNRLGTSSGYTLTEVIQDGSYPDGGADAEHA